MSIGKLLPCGYRNNAALIERMMAIHNNCLIVDARYKPSGNPAWTRAVLEQRYGDRYQWWGEYLGNVNYRSHGAAFKLVNEEPALQQLQGYLEQGWHVILLCACEQHDQCHRSLITHLLSERLPALKVVQPRS